jgi:hypothetical protein
MTLDQNTLLGFVILLVFIPVIVNLLSDEIADWIPNWSSKIVRLAASKLPVNIRDRYLADWLAEIEYIPGKISRLWFAISLFRGLKSLIKTHSKRRTEILQIAKALRNLRKRHQIYGLALSLNKRVNRPNVGTSKWFATAWLKTSTPVLQNLATELNKDLLALESRVDNL